MGSVKKVGNYWAIDSQNVYYLGIDAKIGKYKTPIGDYSTFRELSYRYAADAKCVYYENKLVEGADPGSFSVLEDEQDYGQDKNCVYYQARGTSIRDLNTLRHKNMKDGLRHVAAVP